MRNCAIIEAIDETDKMKISEGSVHCSTSVRKVWKKCFILCFGPNIIPNMLVYRASYDPSGVVCYFFNIQRILNLDARWNTVFHVNMLTINSQSNLTADYTIWALRGRGIVMYNILISSYNLCMSLCKLRRIF